MFRTFKIIEENEESTTYVYNTCHSWIFLIILLILMVGIVSEIFIILVFGILLACAYIMKNIFIDQSINKKIRKAQKTSSVQISGNKYSFSNPLKIKVPRNK
jgi:MFS superfamily sulfate permease-like transporter